jgi:hypothetical protein
MVTTCTAGDCTVDCSGGCICIANTDIPHDCFCDCTDPSTKPAGKKVSYQNRIKITPQARYNICFRNVSITTLVQSFDKVFPNRILVPANKLTKKVNLSLKNNTFRQIIISARLTIKS